MLSGKLSFHNYKILKKEKALSEMSKCHMSKWMKIIYKNKTWMEIKWKINNMACVQLNKWTNETNINDNQQMVTGTPCKPEPIIPKKKYCTWNASGSHK